jgi:ABC-type multidrug transport system fused ATPase/permease subunit
MSKASQVSRSSGIEDRSLASLGAGGEEDRLRFRAVMQIAWRSLPYLRPVRRDLLRFAGLAIPILVLFVVALFFGLDLFFNRVLIGEPLTELSAKLLRLDPALFVEVEELSRDSRRALVGRLGAIAIPGVLSLIFLVIGTLAFWVKLLQRINQQLRVEMMARLQTLSLRFHSEHQSGDSIYRIYQDSAMVTSIIHTLLLEPIGRILVSLFGLSFVYAFDPRLALIFLLSSMGLMALGFVFSGPLRVGFRSAREANSALTSRIQMAMAGIRVVKAYGFEGVVQQRIERSSSRALEMAFRARVRWVLYGICVFAVTGAGLLIAEGFMAIMSGRGDETHAAQALLAVGFAVWNLGAFTAARERIGSASRGVEDLANLWARAQEMAVGLDRAFQILDLEPDVKEAEDAAPMAPFRDSVRFRGVAFAYEAGRPVLDGVDLRVRKGEVTAIVGPTGSGKSTLVALLLRLFDPDGGSVEIDGVDLKRLQLDSLRGQVAIVLQENILFKATIQENIRYAAEGASDAEVEAAARIAGLDELLDQEAPGLESELGERGSKLSSGQRQRIGIARAVVRDAPILILDEPTAALDARTERRVMERLAEWGRGRAIVLITHRLSTIRRADQIVFIREGRVIEAGSHAELMAHGDGAYRRFVDLEEGRE